MYNHICIYISLSLSLFRWVEYLVDRFKLLRVHDIMHSHVDVSPTLQSIRTTRDGKRVYAVPYGIRERIFFKSGGKGLESSWHRFSMDSPKKCKTMLVCSKMIDNHAAKMTMKYSYKERDIA